MTRVHAERVDEMALTRPIPGTESLVYSCMIQA